MPLLLCDLDDTLVDRGAAFARWAAEFAARARPGRRLRRLAVPRSTTRGFGPRPEFFVQIHERLALAQTVDELVADYYGRCPPAVPQRRRGTGRARVGTRARLVASRSSPTALTPSTTRSITPASSHSSTRGACRRPRVTASPTPACSSRGRTLRSHARRRVDDRRQPRCRHRRGERRRHPQRVAPARPARGRAAIFAPTHVADSFPEAVEMVLSAHA